VSLPALRRNFQLISDFVSPHATICAVVKCDAYGHGAVECARALEASGAKWLGVTSADEGIELRLAGISGRILLMSGIWRGEAEAVVEHNLTPAVWSEEQVAALNDAAEKLGRQAFPVHVEVDTGMARQGVPLKNLPALLDVFRKAKSICLEGLHSHLASAEVVDAPDAEEQFARYQQALEILAAAHLRPACVHMANSAAIFAHQRSWKDSGKNDRVTLVRPGISLYGYYLPFAFASGKASEIEAPALQPVLSWKTRIIDLRSVVAGQGIGYNGAYVTSAPAKIATIPVGYGDGYSRRLSSCGQVLLRGQIVPVVGNISMDVTTIDATAVPGAEVGDEVVLIGEQGSRELTAWDIARQAGTIPYEVLCAISKRVPRLYKPE
jgi:alanine racemase